MLFALVFPMKMNEKRLVLHLFNENSKRNLINTFETKNENCVYEFKIIFWKISCEVHLFFFFNIILNILYVFLGYAIWYGFSNEKWMVFTIFFVFCVIFIKYDSFFIEKTMKNGLRNIPAFLIKFIKNPMLQISLVFPM